MNQKNDQSCPYHKEYEQLKTFEEYFIAQVEVIKELTGLIDKLGRPARLNDTGVLLLSLMSNGHAIKGLISSGFFSEGYIIGRSFFEKCVNFCYLNVCDDEEYDNHLSWTFGKIVQSVYARQKAHINLGEEIPLPEISKIIKDEKY